MEALLMLTSILLFFTKNPVKMSLMVLASAGLIFLIVAEKSASSWFPLIMAMMFTGGVLIMFLILSSFHPNEQTLKMKISMSTMILVTVLIWAVSPGSGSSMPMGEPSQALKSTFQKENSAINLTLIIILYFSSFLLILKKEKNSMRLLMC